MSIVDSVLEDIVENNTSLVNPFFSDYAIDEITKMSISEARELISKIGDKYNIILACKYGIIIHKMNKEFQMSSPDKPYTLPYFPILTGEAIDE